MRKSRVIHSAECVAAGMLSLFAVAVLGGAARACDDPLNCPTKLHAVNGTGQKIGNAEIKTWAKLNRLDQVREVGVTVPYSLIENPPPPDAPMPGMTMTAHGKGDAAPEKAEGVAAMGSMPPQKILCVIPFPDVVKKTAYFDHFEMDWNPLGHEPKVFEDPHFDFHFYAIPPTEVEKIASFDPNPPEPQYLPEGYIYPGGATFVPRMGVHTGLPSIMEPPFNAVMIAGFDKGRMHFIEPMVTQAYLKRKQSFSLDVPRPKALGRKTLYPTKFEAKYDSEAEAYHLVFSAFESMS